MKMFRRALEDIGTDASEEKTIVMKGPLSEVYTQALNVAYAKEIDTDETNEGLEVPALEAAKTDKKKKGKLDIEVKKNAFHKWLGKNPGDKITEADIEKGLRSKDAHVNKMAQFAKNARKWQKKLANESLSFEEFNDVIMESQQMDVAIMQKMAASMNNKTSKTDNFQTVFGVSKDSVEEDDVVDVTSELAKSNADKGEFILILDAVNTDKGDDTDSVVSERATNLSAVLECMVLCHGGKVFSSLSEFSKNR